MQKNPASKIKTVILDPEIFTTKIQMNNKLTTPLIKNLTQRKNREFRKLKEQRQQKSSKKIEKQEVAFSQHPYINPADFKSQNTQFDHFAQFDNEFLNHHTKTKLSIHRKVHRSERKTDCSRYNHTHSHSHTVQHRHEDPETIFQQFNKDYEQDESTFKDNDLQSPRINNRLRVNPYTKDQYIYMKNRKTDELMQFRRTGKLTRMNSLTKSYRIATMSLTPQSTSSKKRVISYRIPMPSIPNKGRQTSMNNTSFLRNHKRQSEIKPWQWNGAQQSKEYGM